MATMKRPLNDWVTLWMAVSTLLCCVQAVPLSTLVDCSLDDDSTNPKLDTCLQMGQSFADKYEKALRKQKSFDQCDEYHEFGECLRPMLNRCPEVNTTLPHKWKTLLQTMDQACCDATECPVNLECMHKEYNGIYSQLCRQMYSFNILQDTHGKCRFLREKLDCEESIIASSCGEQTGKLYMSIMKASIRKEKCLVHHDQYQTKHFKFSERCPQNLTEEIKQCAKLHPKNTILEFRKSNNLIAEARKKQIRNSCSHYESYKTCLDDLSHRCEEGIDKVLQFNHEQRVYQLKMDYICLEHKRDYLNNINCYQKTMNTTYKQCENVWNKLAEYLTMPNMTSYLFYCQPQNPFTRTIKRELIRLQSCYEDVIRNECEDVGAQVMGGLIARVFEDPMYLKFKYKPDCALHEPIIVDTPQEDTSAIYSVDRINNIKPNQDNNKKTVISESSNKNEGSSPKHTTDNNISNQAETKTKRTAAVSSASRRNYSNWLLTIICLVSITCFKTITWTHLFFLNVR